MVNKPKQSILSRSVHVQMQRKPPAEEKESLPHDLFEQLEPMRRDLATIAAACAEQVRGFETKFSTNRTRDNWRELMAIAALASPDWEAATEAAAIKFELEQGKGGEDYRHYLLNALGAFFRVWRASHPEIKKGERFFVRTDDILSHTHGLNSDKEAPWFDDRAKELTAHRLSGELGAYGIKSDRRWETLGSKKVCGYWSDKIEITVTQYTRTAFKAAKPPKTPQSSLGADPQTGSFEGLQP